MFWRYVRRYTLMRSKVTPWKCAAEKVIVRTDLKEYAVRDVQEFFGKVVKGDSLLLAGCTHGLLHLRCGDLAVLLGDSMKTSWQGTVALLQSEFFSQFQDGHILVLINKAIGGLVEEGK